MFTTYDRSSDFQIASYIHMILEIVNLYILNEKVLMVITCVEKAFYGAVEEFFFVAG